jgi:hypothetical protein
MFTEKEKAQIKKDLAKARKTGKSVERGKPEDLDFSNTGPDKGKIAPKKK